MKLFRNFVRASPLIYPHIAKNRSEHAIFPNIDTELVLEAYQRSGNTFAYYISKTLVPGLKIAHHTHSVASLKMGVKLNKPIITIVRRPSDAVASASLYKIKFGENPRKSIRRSIEDYYTFHKYLQSISFEHIKILSFDELTESPSKFISMLSEIKSFEKPNDSFEVVKEATRMQATSEKSRKISQEQSTLKSLSRLEISSQIKRWVHLEFEKQILKCENLYEQIIK